MATIPYGTLVRDILGRFPIRNSQWHHSSKTDAITAEVSSVRGATDPWNRPLPPASQWEIFRDGEGDITHWKISTTVAGVHIELTLFND